MMAELRGAVVVKLAETQPLGGAGFAYECPACRRPLIYPGKFREGGTDTCGRCGREIRFGR